MQELHDLKLSGTIDASVLSAPKNRTGQIC